MLRKSNKHGILKLSPTPECCPVYCSSVSITPSCGMRKKFCTLSLLRAITAADSFLEAGVPLRVERLLANLGYGKRRECATMVKKGQVVFKETGLRPKVRCYALVSITSSYRGFQLSMVCFIGLPQQSSCGCHTLHWCVYVCCCYDCLPSLNWSYGAKKGYSLGVFALLSGKNKEDPTNPAVG